MVRDWVLGIEGGPLVSLAVATNVLAALTGSASGGLTIAIDSLGDAYMKIAAERGIDPGLMHRVAVIGAGTLDMLPHNGAVVTVPGRLRRDPPRKLFRHRHGWDRQLPSRTRRRDWIGKRFRVVLRGSRLRRGGIDMPDAPLIKGYFAALRLIVGAVMSSACLMRVMTPVGPRFEHRRLSGELVPGILNLARDL